jgi:hypothetical protein
LKIALCIPCHGDPKAKFMQCLVSMVVHTLGARLEIDGEEITPEIELFVVSCSLLTEARNRLVAEAIHWEADYMLWLDADHVFPRDALVRLLSLNLPVVGCNYARRFSPTSPTASVEVDGKHELTWTEKGKGVEEVSHLGLGLCLIDMRVFGALERKATEDGKEHFWPLFRIDPTEDGIRFVGEDVYFFKRIREAGVPVHCDHDLSVDVGHIHEQIMTYAHCIRDREKWTEFQARKMDKFREKEAV